MFSRKLAHRLLNFKCIRSITQGQWVRSQPLKTDERPLVLEHLQDRDVIRVRGDEAFEFLQGITTNNMNNLGKNTGESRSMYSMFLNKNGRVLYDSIIYSVHEPNTYLIECDKRVSNELRRLLRTYRVRRKIDIDAADRDYKPWVLFNSAKRIENSDESVKTDKEMCALGDPRLPELGMRLITPADVNWSDLAKHLKSNFSVLPAEATQEDNYIQRRFCNGIAEGVDDIPPGQCFPFETNADFLNALSFNKGCYIGQELTARVHYTGVVRKRYMPLKLTAPLGSVKDVQTQAGNRVGKIISNCNKYALALIRVEPALNAECLEIDGDPCYLEKPYWWPDDALKQRNPYN